MAQTGYTPIKLYSSSTASAVPLAANLATGELAININDGKLFYKDSSGVVQTIATKDSAAITLPLSVSNGGTNITSYTTGDILYASGTTTLAKLALGTTNYVLTAGASAPQYVAQSSLSVGNATTATTATTATNIAGGANGSIPYQTGADSTTMLAAGTNGQVLTLASGVPSWATIDALPSQTGNAGKYLTTNGTIASWATVSSNTTTNGLYEMANTISADYSITSGNNAMSAGPITINPGVTVTVPSGSTWVIV